MTHEQALDLAAAFVLGTLTPRGGGRARASRHLSGVARRVRRARRRGAVPPPTRRARRAADVAARRASWPPRPPTSRPARRASAAPSPSRPRAGAAGRARPAVSRRRRARPRGPGPSPDVARPGRRGPRDRRARWLDVAAPTDQVSDLRASSARPGSEYQEAVAAVLDVAADPVPDRDPATAASRPARAGSPRVAADGASSWRCRDLAPTTRQRGLRGLGDRRARRAAPDRRVSGRGLGTAAVHLASHPRPSPA